MTHNNNITEDNFKVIIRLRPLNIKQQEQISIYESAQSKKFKSTSTTKPLKLSPSAYAFYTKFYNISNLSEILKVQKNTVFVVDTEYKNSQKKMKPFVFSNVYNQRQTSEEIFMDQIESQIQGVFEGFNYTVLAYGITGSGKTHTVFGNKEKAQKGISALSLNHLLNKKRQIEKNNPNINIRLGFSFVEIYNQNVRDLLNSQGKILNIIQDTKGNTTFTDAIEISVNSQQQISELINVGLAKRSFGATMANQYSSRSHAIIQMNVHIQTQNAAINSKMFIIDLAGSQKIQSSNSSKKMQQGANINKSLLALGNCINILADNSKKTMNNPSAHIPYRDSKLTRILKDSLGGNAKTLMISCVSSNPFTIQQTITTLNYSQRAQGIKKQIKRNSLNASVQQGICSVCLKQFAESDENIKQKILIPMNLTKSSHKDQMFQMFFSQIYDDIVQNIKQKYTIQTIISQSDKKTPNSEIQKLREVNESQKNQLKQTMSTLFNQKQLEYEQQMINLNMFVDNFNTQQHKKIMSKRVITLKTQQLHHNQNDYTPNDLWNPQISKQKRSISVQRRPLQTKNTNSSQNYGQYKNDNSIKLLIAKDISGFDEKKKEIDNQNSRFSFASLLDSNVKSPSIAALNVQTERSGQKIHKVRKSRSKFEVVRRTSASKLDSASKNQSKASI